LFTLSSVSSSACLFHAWKVSSRGELVSAWLDVSNKRKQARRERQSELRLVNSLYTLWRDRKKK